MLIRPAEPRDRPAIATMIMPTIAAGETYALDPTMSEDDALAYWLGADRETFVAEDKGWSSGRTTCARTRLSAVAMSATAAT